jgi:hypothetical protein
MKAYTYNDRLVGVGNDQILGTDQGGGSTYTAGNGIDITNDVISVDDTVALKTDIPVVTGFATQSWVSEQGYLTAVPSEYITDSELNATVSGLATKSELQTVSAAIPELPDEEEVEFEELDLTDYALASAIPDISGLATKTELQDGLELVTGLIPDTSDMATKTWVGNQGYLTSVPEGYATDIEVSQAIASSIVQSDWAVTAVDSPAYIENKPETLEMELSPVTGGNCISITEGNAGSIDWITTAGITDIVSVTALPANPVATVIYLIPET